MQVNPGILTECIRILGKAHNIARNLRQGTVLMRTLPFTQPALDEFVDVLQDHVDDLKDIGDEFKDKLDELKD